MATGRDDGDVDFFISYTGVDAPWAEWIAWTLEKEGGFSTLIQAWDVVPGTNFVLWMHEATRRSKRVIMVCSPEYLERPYTKAEWAALLRDDPEGTKASVVPVIVRACEPRGLLGPLVWIDLQGMDQDAARDKLLDGLRMVPGDRTRNKPAFPGHAVAAGGPSGTVGMPSPLRRTPPFPAHPSAAASPMETPKPKPAALTWDYMDHEPPAVGWVEQLFSGGTPPTGDPGIELHLIPEQTPQLTGKDLADLRLAMTECGKRHGLFASDYAVDLRHNHEYVIAVTSPTSVRSQAARSGLAVTRDGQRSVWRATPAFARSRLAASEESLQETIAELVPVLLSLRPQVPGRVAFAVGIEVETADGRKVTARLEPQRWIARDTAAANPAEVAQELAQRLNARI